MCSLAFGCRRRRTLGQGRRGASFLLLQTGRGSIPATHQATTALESLHAIKLLSAGFPPQAALCGVSPPPPPSYFAASLLSGWQVCALLRVVAGAAVREGGGREARQTASTLMPPRRS
ncbi:hypothetical protein I4F81_005969 [Pyropia yezoensis]|uniref:Uncharacterized protein n=1 Tax=Pyropia yezoensis TaxID=2788 RepID=A0ACC3C0N7_PYRYE|nr:hypothetical protein I4F81_005969 [Neopyropia yezoensis]